MVNIIPRPDRPKYVHLVLKEVYGQEGEELFISADSDRARNECFKLKEERFKLDN